MKKSIIKTILILIVSIISIMIILSKPSIVLKGQKKIEIKLNEEYKEYGYIATYMTKDYSKMVKVKSNVDPSKVGEYEIIYSLNVKGKKSEAIRKVIVRDKTKPRIALQGEGYACPKKEYIEEGYKAEDDYDGDLTDKVKVKKSKDKLIYIVSDSSGNKTKIDRKITYKDKTGPNISLNGDENIDIYLGYEFNDPGYEVTDNCDSNPKIEVFNDIDFDNIGKYTITYKATDMYGNETIKERYINIIEKNSPPSNDGRGKVIYLTFDDGPSSTITPELLNILKEEGVKATFFVINHDDSLNYLIRREYDEGHQVALHSFTHSYSYVYSSENDYFDDLNAIREKVHNITGNYTNLIRFPGGSSNTVSRNYNLGIMSRLVNEVTNKGYVYFDWNVSSGDAGGSDTTEEVYDSVVSNLVYKYNVVLMHDYEGNYKTLNAIRDIIHYGKANGYTFDTLSSDSYTAHHGINN